MHGTMLSSSPRPSGARALALVCAPALLALGLAAQTAKLNLPLPGPSSDVLDFQLDPGGTRAVYLADQDQAGVLEIYSVRIDLAAPPIRLNAALPPGGDIATTYDLRNFQISTSGRAVYRADGIADETFELFSVPIDGGLPPVRLNLTPAPGGDVVFLALSSDGAQVVYVADQDTDEVFELYAAPIDGSAPPLALHPGFPDQDVQEAWIGPDGTVIHSVLPSPAGDVGTFELHGVPIDGSQPPVLLVSRTFGVSIGGAVSVTSMVFSPDGEHSAIRLRETTFFSSFSTLWLVPTDGSAAAQALGSNSVLPAFTSDGERLIFTSSSDFPGGQPDHHVFSATLAGAVTPLDDPVAEGPRAVRLGPDGDTVYFQYSAGVYRAPADGGLPAVLLAAAASCSGSGLELSPDGSRVVLVVADCASQYELRSVPSAGGASTLLAALRPHHVRVTPDSKLVLYEVPASGDLFLAAIDGSRAPRRLNEPLPPGGTLFFSPYKSFSAIAGQDWAVYLASQETAGVFELFRAQLRPVRGAHTRR